MIKVVVLGCDPIRTGEGAAAPFIGVHILGKIRPAGGFDTLAESRWEDQIGPSISDAAARNIKPSACIRFEVATRPRFLRAV